VRRVRLLGFLLAVAILAAGCRPQYGTPGPAPGSTPAAAVTPAEYRVAIVDLEQLLRVHRRWAEFETLNRRMDAIHLRLSSPPPPPEPPQSVAAPDLQSEGDRLRASYTAELDALREQLHRRVEAFANDLRAEQEAKLADYQRELNVTLTKTVEARRDELQRDLERFELATMAEYRVPLANLRVRADVVGLASEEEARRVQAEAERIQAERDQKIRTRAQALEQQMQEFSQARTAEAEGTFKAFIATLEDEARTKIEAEETKARQELEAEVRKREELFRVAMEGRHKVVVEGAQDQFRQAQERYVRQVEAEAARLRTELRALDEQRLRLEDSMLAEIKIEVAAAAQARRIDAVVTRALAYPNVIDLTEDVASRLK
jgi:hypothetical protein